MAEVQDVLVFWQRLLALAPVAAAVVLAAVSLALYARLRAAERALEAE